LKKEPRLIKKPSQPEQSCSTLPGREDVREQAAKELNKLACEVGRIQQRLATLEKLLKVA
jgi:hypothetical protein